MKSLNKVETKTLKQHFRLSLIMFQNKFTVMYKVYQLMYVEHTLLCSVHGNELNMSMSNRSSYYWELIRLSSKRRASCMMKGLCFCWTRNKVKILLGIIIVVSEYKVGGWGRTQLTWLFFCTVVRSFISIKKDRQN